MKTWIDARRCTGRKSRQLTGRAEFKVDAIWRRRGLQSVYPLENANKARAFVEALYMSSDYDF